MKLPGIGKVFQKACFFFCEYWFKLSMFIIALCYLLFPNNNHLGDSLGYAASVKYGMDLFSPHHLLFSYFYFVIFKAVSFIFPSLDALRFMQFGNGIFALFSLFLLRKILVLRTNDSVKANLWVLFVACSFAVMRFAVEAETYILPVFISLLSSYYYLKYLKTSRLVNIFLCGFFASLACLFHQIHLFWGIGLFVGLLLFTRRLKPLFLFFVPTPIVLIVYSLVLVLFNHVDFSVINLFRFLADYYYSDNADVSVGTSNVIITAITFFRTFFQVHGLVVSVLRLSWLTYLVVAIVLILTGYSVIKLIRTIEFEKISRSKSIFELTHLAIFVLQFGFAFYSHGNSEFMVMLPFVLAVFLSMYIRVDLVALRNLSIAMFIWNMIFGILPNHFLDYQRTKIMSKIVHDNSDKVFIVREKTALVNQYFYDFGMIENQRVIESTDKKSIRKFKAENAVFYTDILTKQMPYTRVNFTEDVSLANLKFVRHVVPVKSSLADYFVDEVKSSD